VTKAGVAFMPCLKPGLIGLAENSCSPRRVCAVSMEKFYLVSWTRLMENEKGITWV
jgi:hypothetical protein